MVSPGAKASNENILIKRIARIHIILGNHSSTFNDVFITERS